MGQFQSTHAKNTSAKRHLEYVLLSILTGNKVRYFKQSKETPSACYWEALCFFQAEGSVPVSPAGQIYVFINKQSVTLLSTEGDQGDSCATSLPSVV